MAWLLFQTTQARERIACLILLPRLWTANAQEATYQSVQVLFRRHSACRHSCQWPIQWRKESQRHDVSRLYTVFPFIKKFTFVKQQRHWSCNIEGAWYIFANLHSLQEAGTNMTAKRLRRPEKAAPWRPDAAHGSRCTSANNPVGAAAAQRKAANLRFTMHRASQDTATKGGRSHAQWWSWRLQKC